MKFRFALPSLLVAQSMYIVAGLLFPGFAVTAVYVLLVCSKVPGFLSAALNDSSAVLGQGVQHRSSPLIHMIRRDSIFILDYISVICDL